MDYGKVGQWQKVVQDVVGLLEQVQISGQKNTLILYNAFGYLNAVTADMEEEKEKIQKASEENQEKA